MSSLETTHKIMNQRVSETTFCPEEEGQWNTRLLHALGQFEFIGDIVLCKREDFDRRVQLGRETWRRLMNFLDDYGLDIGIPNHATASWVRPA